MFLEAKRKKEAKARKEKQEEGGEALPEQPFSCTIRACSKIFLGFKGKCDSYL